MLSFPVPAPSLAGTPAVSAPGPGGGRSRRPVASRRARSGKPSLDLSGAVIAILEDDEDSLDVLAQMVAAFGASVLVAPNGAEGKRLLAAPPAPDLVLCDLMMPGVNGFEFMEWVSAQPHLSRVPVLAVTALGTDADVMATWEAGFSGHILKPIDLEMIEAQLERVFWAHRLTQKD